ncbi:MAG: Ig-like domain-containing protein [Bacteroidales bacterium]|nr:Ig-like domain-containing protein [Bacteroidales bacterium]
MKRLLYMTLGLVLFVYGCKKAQSSIPVTEINVSPTEVTMKEGDAPIHLTVTILPEEAANITVTWQSSNTLVATVDDGTVTAVSEGTASITATAGGKTATCQITVLAGFKAVDMGLSVLWANMDLGAKEVGEYGSFYAWAEVEANKSNYDQETYKWGNYSNLSKYLPLSYNGRKDEKAFLDEEDDAAHTDLGGEWRIPTVDEASELFETRENDNYRWTTIEVNGHSCRKITYLVNGNSILLPFSGYKFRGGVQLVGSRHTSWTANNVVSSSSMHMAYIMNAFPQDVKAGAELEGITRRDRWVGCTIRPVKAPRRIPMCSMSFDTHDKAIAENTTFTPTVTIWPENADNKTLKWKSDDPEVASVDKNGVVTAHNSGYTSIWCSHGALQDILKIEVAPFGYGIYVKNELGWEKIYLVARIVNQPNFTGTPGQEPEGESNDGYLYFKLDESMMEQELYYRFVDGKGNSSAEFRKASYSKRIIFTTLK